MHSEKEGKYMETHKAKVIVDGSDHILCLTIGDSTLMLPLTKDEPNEIKKLFNDLIVHLKKGPFEFSMVEKEDGDLIYHVAKEYIDQLNKELSEVYQELEAYHLIESQ